ncbi:acid-activated periplasmic chaperone HdeA [Cronobacter sp. EKM101R]|uniref:acid-activated periplasmic chaperone HdeA n=1 Tax=Cronobacter TaxID=413496 RepID=UPI0013EA7BDD|nr:MULTISPECIES: acid-activated periplasmic chaperone HdeA [Cronobacter]KAF6592441.1 acid-activated periplasmic chaperone HdeA [Cronobacter sp. EKM101R]KAF6595030.1 acid-activated periplasmic chaperone HdeA [Cronobacter sp. EKM102R]MDK1186245.1 acid-activated periplasmic chaperone HdeA [Cronobacter turicensis]MDK1194627.1 acid-activated periplasmic chaperone HdeA [Cronobacter dublinensis]MDK1199919.1 acid-activated periplasmic chaperone HdeA [Cronobacter dublinensis]
MKRKLLLVGLTTLLTFSSFSQASDNKEQAHKKPVSTWTCEDFLALDASFQPTAVSFIEDIYKEDKAESAVLDVDGITKVTPMVIEACKQAPKESFRDKVKSEWGKVKKDV